MSTAIVEQCDPQVEARARQTLGTSDSAIYQMVADALRHRKHNDRTLVDVGCGTGQLWAHVSQSFSRYVGVDCIRYEGFPDAGEFHRVNLESGRTDLPDNCADVVAAVETIEHVENPWALMRELVRLTRPGGLVIVTTPNQLSLLSLLALIVKKRFVSFQDVHYPAHLTALLEIDLKRMAAACGLTEVETRFSEQGRVLLTPLNYPKRLSRLFPRALSDNVLVVGRKAN